LPSFINSVWFAEKKNFGMRIGMGIVPDPPPNKVLFDDSRGWGDMLAYRTKLVHARNAQLEYQQNISGLHGKIRQACKDLLKKDDNVIEDMETLALERGRLGYLRDELARRADMLSKWERKMRENDPNWVSQYFPKNSKEEQQKKERDLFNAMVVELDHKRRLLQPVESAVYSRDEQLDLNTRLDTNVAQKSSRRISVQHETTPWRSSSESPQKSESAEPISVNNTPVVDRMIHIPFVRENLPTSPPDMSDAQVNTDNRASVGVMAKAASLPSSHSQTGLVAAERAFTDEFTASPESDRFFREMVHCLDFLWAEYSTVIGEDVNYRLMSLANMMRMCGEADFGISTTEQIDVFLTTLRENRSEYSLIEYRYFLPLLHRIIRVLLYPESTQKSSVELTDVLFKHYLFPLMQRVRMVDRQFSDKHPRLPPSPIHSAAPRRKLF
jgi:hypothetical protein